jgi:hypothetical protein
VQMTESKLELFQSLGSPFVLYQTSIVRRIVLLSSRGTRLWGVGYLWRTTETRLGLSRAMAQARLSARGIREQGYPFRAHPPSNDSG